MPNPNTSLRIEIGAIAILVAMTVLLFLADHFLLNKTLALHSSKDVWIYAGDDRIIGGQSVASLEKKADHLLLNCEINLDKYAWPYCSLLFDFTKKTPKINKQHGYDLSDFESISINAHYIGEVENKIDLALRLQTHNFNPAYSKVDDFNSLKYNAIEYFPERETTPTVIKMADFKTAPWWVTEYKIPIALAGTEFSNTYVFEIATATNTQFGHYQLRVDEVLLKGRIIPSSQIYFAMSVLWLLSGVCYLFIKLAYYAKALKKAKTRSRALSQQVERDTLTGALNRIALDRFLLDENQFKATEQALSVIFCDIDYFKKINDSQGHLVGDQVLVHFVELLQRRVRQQDKIVRWGGEEFLVVCSHTDIDEAFKLAEELRKTIAAADFPEQLKVTSSFGVAQLAKETTDELFNRADLALYQAKAQGRNKVVKALFS